MSGRVDDLEALIAELRSTVTVPARNAYPPLKVKQLGPRAAEEIELVRQIAALAFTAFLVWVMFK